MQANDIARITYELVRIRDDRQTMKWEDDRGYLLREIERLSALHRRDEQTQRSLRKQIDEIKIAMLSSKNKNKGEKSNNREKAKDVSSSSSSSNCAKRTAPIAAGNSKDYDDVQAKPSVHAAKATAAAITGSTIPVVKLEKSSATGSVNHKRQKLSFSGEEPQVEAAAVIPATPIAAAIATKETTPGPATADVSLCVVLDGSPARSTRSSSNSRDTSRSVPGSIIKGKPSSSSGNNKDVGKSKGPRGGNMTTGNGSTRPAPLEVKYIDDSGQNRRHDVREGLPGHVCFQCRQYFDVLRAQGIIVDDEQMRKTLQNCSRHKSKYSPPSTPAGFWDMTVKTPEDWK